MLIYIQKALSSISMDKEWLRATAKELIEIFYNYVKRNLLWNAFSNSEMFYILYQTEYSLRSHCAS